MNTTSMTQSIFGDLLQEVDMKPWWERLRSYCVGVIITCCFIIAQMSMIFYKVDCVPLNTTQDFDFSRAKSIYISNVCSNQLPIIFRFFRVAEVGLSALLLIATSWWSLRPSVVNSFRSYRKVEDLLDELLLTMEVLDDADKTKEAVEDKKQRMKLDKIRQLAKDIEAQKNLRKIYIIRNVLLMFSALGCVAGFIVMWHLSTADSTFPCNLNKRSMYKFEDILKYLGGISEYSCSHDLARKLPPYYIIIISASVIQFVLVLIGTLKVCNCCTKRQDSDKNFPWKVGQFIEIFWRNARPVGKGHFRKYAVLLLSEKSTIQAVYCLHYTRNPTMLLKQMETKAESGSCTIDQKDMGEYIRDLTIDENIRNDLSSTLSKLAKAKEWKLLVELLDKIEELHDGDKDVLKKINLHEIGKPFHTGRSVMSYALDCSNGCDRMQAAKHILKHSEDIRPCYVYMNEQKYPPRPPESYKSKIRKREQVEPSEVAKLLDSREGTFVTSEEDWLLGDYSTTVQRMRRGEDVSVEEEMKAAEDISHRRFLVWSEEMKKISLSLAQNQRWILFVELLNCYVGDKSKNCGVTSFETDKKNEVGPLKGSILYYALTRPIYRVNFAYPAIEYILQQSTNEIKYVWNEVEQNFTAAEFVDSNGELNAETKTLLKEKLDANQLLQGTKSPDAWMSSKSVRDPTRGYDAVFVGSNRQQDDERKPILKESMSVADKWV